MANIFDTAINRWRAFTTDDLATGGGGGGGGTTADREVVVTTYSVTTAFTGASVGDVVTCTQVLNVLGTSPATVAVLWTNQTTAADLASPPSAANIKLVGISGGDASAANQQTQITALNNILTIETTAAGRIGATDESAPASDTASSGLNGRLQRIAQRLTSLIGLLPSSLGGKTAANSLAVTLASDGAGVVELQSIRDRLPSTLVLNRLQTDVLGQPGVARQQAATTSPATITLTTTVRRVSLAARTSNLRYVVGTGSVVANASTSHFIAAGERLDIAVPANGLIGVIRDTAATADGVLEVTEL